jgi:hypothetical protein
MVVINVIISLEEKVKTMTKMGETSSLEGIQIVMYIQTANNDRTENLMMGL